MRSSVVRARLFAVTAIFGLCTVLGLNLLADLVSFELTLTLRYRGELVVGLVRIFLVFFPLVAQSAAPGWALAAMRQRPWSLGFVGIGASLFGYGAGVQM